MSFLSIWEIKLTSHCCFWVFNLNKSGATSGKHKNWRIQQLFLPKHWKVSHLSLAYTAQFPYTCNDWQGAGVPHIHLCHNPKSLPRATLHIFTATIKWDTLLSGFHYCHSMRKEKKNPSWKVNHWQIFLTVGINHSLVKLLRQFFNYSIC